MSLNLVFSPCLYAPAKLAESEHFLVKEVGSRTAALFNLPVLALIGIADVGLGVLSIAGLGLTRRARMFTNDQLMESTRLGHRAYCTALRFINPKNDPWFIPYNGFTHKHVVWLRDKALDCGENAGLKYGLISRSYHLLYALVSIVTRLADGVISFIAVPASLLTAAKFPRVNQIAHESSQALGLVRDLGMAILYMINPRKIS